MTTSVDEQGTLQLIRDVFRERDNAQAELLTGTMEIRSDKLRAANNNYRESIKELLTEVDDADRASDRLKEELKSMQAAAEADFNCVQRQRIKLEELAAGRRAFQANVEEKASEDIKELEKRVDVLNEEVVIRRATAATQVDRLCALERELAIMSSRRKYWMDLYTDASS